jgi:hypothetical protein
MQKGARTIRPGFLAKPNRINVAISRAMDRLVLIGSRTRWEDDSPMDRIAKAFSRNLDAGHASSVDAVALMEDRIDVSPVDDADDHALEVVR